MKTVGKEVLRWVASLVLIVVMFAAIVGGMVLPVLLLKRPVQMLLDSPAGNQLGGPVILLIIILGLFGGLMLLWLAFVAVNEVYRHLTGRNLMEDYDPVFWRDSGKNEGEEGENLPPHKYAS